MPGIGTKLPSKASDDWGYYLSTIQAAINRMSSNSAIFKSLGATAVIASIAASFGILFPSFTNGCNFPYKKWIVLIALVSSFFVICLVVLFWAFDAMYLRYERGYVALYKEQLEKRNNGEAPSFEMKPQNDTSSFWGCFWSSSVTPFYTVLGSLSVLLVVSTALIALYIMV